MKTLITPSEVISLAFGSPNTLSESAVPSYAILSAEESFLLPVLGREFYERLREERNNTDEQRLIADYLAQPLALYVASRLLPTLALQVGSAGVVRLSGESFEAADEMALRRAVSRLRADADRLLARALDYAASYPELYPSYNPQTTSHRIVGGVVM